MNSAVKASISNPSTTCFYLRTALFHSTPVLERRGRSFYECRSSNNNSSRRSRRFHSRQLRNLSAYAEYLFQSWQSEFHAEVNPFSTGGPSWFKKQYSNDSRREWTGKQGSQRCGRRGFRLFEDDIEDDPEIENIFQSTFGGNRFFYWSFINEDNSQSRRSSGYSNNHGNSRSQKYNFAEDDDPWTESESLDSDMASDRLALGLSASGPLKLQDVKTAYRVCALKWHPDRHQGSSKAVAEEKFKLCCAAYQTLCDKLAMN